MICENFCNYHCSFDCPNFACDMIEERYDIPCSDAGYERVKCKECVHNQNKSCDDCYLQGSEYCKRKVVKNMQDAKKCEQEKKKLLTK